MTLILTLTLTCDDLTWICYTASFARHSYSDVSSRRAHAQKDGHRHMDLVTLIL